MAEPETEAEETTNPEEGAEEAPKKGKKGVLLIGGIVGLIGVAYVASMMAVPSTPEHVTFQGPFVTDLQGEGEQVQVNLAGDGNKRYLVMALKVAYDSYKEGYAVSRIADPYVSAMLKDALLSQAAEKSVEQVTTALLQDVFLEEIRVGLDPILFPAHVGEGETFTAPDPKSGLAPGQNWHQSTLRGPLYEHVLKVDAPRGTLQLDEGPEVELTEAVGGSVKVSNEAGDFLWVDVTNLEPDFVGEVPAGVRGRIRQILRKTLLVQ